MHLSYGRATIHTVVRSHEKRRIRLHANMKISRATERIVVTVLHGTVQVQVTVLSGPQLTRPITKLHPSEGLRSNLSRLPA